MSSRCARCSARASAEVLEVPSAALLPGCSRAARGAGLSFSSAQIHSSAERQNRRGRLKEEEAHDYHSVPETEVVNLVFRSLQGVSRFSPA